MNMLQAYSLLEEINAQIVYHGTSEPDIKNFNTEIIWLTTDLNYAKTYATLNGYIYSCIIAKNLNYFDAGDTNNPIYNILPIDNSYSPAFINLLKKLNLSLEQINTLVDQVASDNKYEPDSFGKYIASDGRYLKLFTIIRSKFFKQLCSKAGYDGVTTLEFDRINQKYAPAIGIFDNTNIKIIDHSPVTNK